MHFLVLRETVKDALCINSFSFFGNGWRCIQLLHFMFYIKKYGRIIFQVFINLERKNAEYQDNLPLGQGPKLQAPKQDSSSCFAINTGLAGRQTASNTVIMICCIGWSLKKIMSVCTIVWTILLNIMGRNCSTLKFL